MLLKKPNDYTKQISTYCAINHISAKELAEWAKVSLATAYRTLQNKNSNTGRQYNPDSISLYKMQSYITNKYLDTHMEIKIEHKNCTKETATANK